MLRNRVFAVCATSTMVAAILTAGAPTASGVMSPVLPNGSSTTASTVGKPRDHHCHG